MPVVKTIEQLRQELEAKVLELAKLASYRDKLQAELAAVDRRIGLLHGKAAPVAKRGRRGRKAVTQTAARDTDAPKTKKKNKGKGRRGRKAKGGASLLEAIKGVLANQPDGMRIRDIATAVKDSGYKSAAKDFYTIVATTMREPNVFTKIGRGLYKLA